MVDDPCKIAIITPLCIIAKNDTNEPINKTEIDSQTQKTNL